SARRHGPGRTARADARGDRVLAEPRGRRLDDPGLHRRRSAPEPDPDQGAGPVGAHRKAGALRGMGHPGSQAGLNMLNIAVIGLGWWGRIITDLARKSDKLRVVRVADVSASAEAFASERDLPFSPDFQQVLADPKVQ